MLLHQPEGNMASANSQDQPTSSQPLPVPPQATAPKNRLTGRRKWAYRLVTVVLVPALFLGVVELGLRLFDYGDPTSFFLAREIDEQSVCVENYHFGRRFFPKGLARHPDHCVFAVPKPAGTYRIFVLGESAAQGFPDSSVGFGRILEVMLRESYPQARFEVINTALVAISSHVILPIARDCARHEPDLFVVYMGNNEVIGPFGATGVFGPFSPSLKLIRASIAAKSLRTGQLLGDLTRWTSSAKPVSRRKEQETFAKSQVRADDARLAAIYANFARNLQDISEAGSSAGAKVVVCTVGADLKNTAPFASVPPADLTADRAEAWQTTYDEGVQREAAGQHAKAVESFERALAIDDSVANLHFRLGRCQSALGKPDEARRHFILARDLDALRCRVDTRINEAIRTFAANRQAEGIYLTDVESVFAKASPGGVPGENLFYEYVHMNFEGNYLLAHAVFEQVAGLLPEWVGPRGADPAAVSRQVCMERLAWSAWRRRKAVAFIASFLNEAPFLDQLDCAERNKRVERQLADLNERMRSGGLDDAVRAFRRALERADADVPLHREFAELLIERGEFDEAITHLRTVLKRMPQAGGCFIPLAAALNAQGKTQQALSFCADARRFDPDETGPLNLQGAILLKMGKLAEAIAAFKQALAIDPDDARLHENLGLVLTAQQQQDDAIKAFTSALRLRPHNAGVHLYLANIYRQQNKPDLIVEHLSAAVRIDPDFLDAHVGLGVTLAELGRPEEALEQYRQALRVHANEPTIHFEMAKILARAGKVDEAIGHLEEVVRLQPDSELATQALNELRQKKKR